MKYFPLFFALIFVLTSLTVEKNYKIKNLTLKQIELNIFNEDHKYYYDDLIFEFERGDTMNMEQLMHVYYGAALMRNYHPFQLMAFENDLIKLSDQRQFEKVVKLSDSLLMMRATSLIGCLEHAHSLRKTEDTTLSKVYSNRFRQLKKVIMNSGDGKTPETAFWVTSPKDIDPVIQHKGYFTKSYKDILVNDMMYRRYIYFDKLGKKNKLYFNIDIPMNLGLDIEKEKRKKKKKEED